MKLFLSLIILICTLNSYAADNKLKITMSGSEVVLGEQFTMSISLETGPNVEPFISFDPKNAELIDDNSNDSSRVLIKGVFAGGKLTQKKIYNYKYTFQPVKSGFSFVRNIKIDLGSRILRHKTMRIKVLTKARRLGKYVLRAEVDKTDVYVGEGVELNYYLYFQGNIAQPDVRKFPKLKDFLKRFELPRRNVERAQLNGKVYKRLLIYRAKLYPLKEGKLSVDPVEVAFQYPDIKRGRRDVFGGMSMNFSTSTYKTKKMRSPRVKLNVSALPTENMPANFTGLVGEHQFNLKFANTKILVNDILEARLEVTGEGALERFDPIKLIKSQSVEEFEAKTEIIEMGNLINKKVVDYTFLGKKGSKIPETVLQLSIFDPVKREYVQREVVVPELQILGSGSVAPVGTTITNEKRTESSSKSTSNRDNKSVALVGPIFKASTGKSVYDLNMVNLVLFSLVVILTLSGFSLQLSFKSVEGLGELKKNINYKTLHDFIVLYGGEGTTLREKISNSNISKEAKLYLSDLLEKTEKNEYNGSRTKMKYEKKYIKELLKAHSYANN